MTPTDLVLDVEVKIIARPKDVLGSPQLRNMWTTWAKGTSTVTVDKTTIDEQAALAVTIATFQYAQGALMPTAVAAAPSSVLVTSATFNGTVGPQSVSSVITFEWGISLNALATSSAAAQSPSASATPIAVTFAATLIASTTYYYRIKVVSATGTVWSDPISFTTPAS
jgi:hypothetical protein